MQWSDEGIIIGTRRHGETSLIVELMTVGPWPPSRPRAGRAVAEAPADPPAGQQRHRHLAGAPRRPPRPLHAGRHAPSRRPADRERRRPLRHPGAGRAAAPVAGARPACRSLRGAGCGPRSCVRPCGRGGTGGALRAEDPRRTGLRPRSRSVRRHRRQRRSRLRLAEDGPGGEPRRPASPIATGSCRCRRSCWKPRSPGRRPRPNSPTPSA